MKELKLAAIYATKNMLTKNLKLWQMIMIQFKKQNLPPPL